MKIEPKPVHVSSRKDQMSVFYGILVAWALSIGVYWLGYNVLKRNLMFEEVSSVEVAVFAVLLASIALIIGIGLAAATRHLVSNIDGSEPEIGSRLDLLLRYITNTTEQLVLFIVASTGIAIQAAEIAIFILPVAGAWFLLARMAFLIGYSLNPLARAFGFAATFHPTIVMIGFAIWYSF